MHPLLGHQYSVPLILQTGDLLAGKHLVWAAKSRVESTSLCLTPLVLKGERDYFTPMLHCPAR